MKQIQSSFFVLFYLKKERALKTGEMPICMRVTINKQRLETRIKRSVKPELWSQAKDCCKGKDRFASELNYYIEGLRAQVFQIQMELQLEGKPLTIDIFRKKFFHLDGSEKTLLTAFSEHVEQCTLLIGKDFTFKTVQRYATTAKYLGEFLKKEYNRSDILLFEIDKQFIVKFDIFLKTEKGCAQNAAVTRLKNLKKTLRMDWRMNEAMFSYYGDL